MKMPGFMRIVSPSIPYNDYNVFKSSLDDFRKEIKNSGHANAIVYLEPGETHKFSLRETAQ